MRQVARLAVIALVLVPSFSYFRDNMADAAVLGPQIVESGSMTNQIAGTILFFSEKKKHFDPYRRGDGTEHFRYRIDWFR